MQHTTGDTCSACHGRFDPLSRQATQNHMGPWQVRDEINPFTPGFDDAALRKLCKRGRIHLNTIVRGPTTRQFWMLACNTPVVAALLGQCHACHAPVSTQQDACNACGANLFPQTSRDALGLAPVQPLPGQADPYEVAEAALGASRAFVPPPPAKPAVSGRASERRLRREVAKQKQRVTALAIACVFLALAGLGAAFQDQIASKLNPGQAKTASNKPAEPSSPPPEPPTHQATTEANPQATEPAATATSAPVDDPEIIFDPELEPWRERYRQALDLEALGDLASLQAALEGFEGILFEAEAEVGAGMAAPPELPLLRDKIERLRTRVTRERALDAIRVRD
jgi:hypothetical protein